MEAFQIGSKIKKIREVKNFTPLQMAEKLQITENEYINLEQKDQNLTIANIEAIATILNINPHILFNTISSTDFINNGEINGDNNGSGNNYEQGSGNNYEQGTVNNYEQGTVNNYSNNSKLEKLYEEKIEILENKNTMQLNMLNILNETILNLEQMQIKNTKK